MASSAGAWGIVGDALADVLRHAGIGPLFKWVDDYLFFRVPRRELHSTNTERVLLAARVQREHRGGVILWRDGDRELAEDFSTALLALSPEPNEWAYDFSSVDAVCAPLGVPWSAEKEQAFGPRVTYYGVEFDIPGRIVSLPERKRAGLLLQLREWLTRATFRRDETESLLGKLQFATHVVPNGRQYLTGLVTFLGWHAGGNHSSSRSSGSRNRAFAGRTMHPPTRVRRDLQWWETELDRPRVARCFLNDLTVVDPGLYTDASSAGAAAVIGTRFASYTFAADWKRDGRDIMWAEAVGAELGIRHLVATGAHGQRVRIYVDNTAVEAGIRNGRVQNEAANGCLERLFHFASLHNIVLVSARVTSIDNPADAPSRGVAFAGTALATIDLPAALRGLVTRV